MAISYQVFLERERLPTGAAWLQELRDRGFAVEFAPELDPAAHTGYLACPDERVGFELYSEPFSSAPAEVGRAGLDVIGRRDTTMIFRFSGRPADREAAVAAAATLTAMTDGVLFDTESGHFIDARSALGWARNEEYRPVATYRARARRRRGRISASAVIRILMLLLITVVFFVLFGR